MNSIIPTLKQLVYCKDYSFKTNKILVLHKGKNRKMPIKSVKNKISKNKKKYGQVLMLRPQATPRTSGKVSNTGTQTADTLPPGPLGLVDLEGDLDPELTLALTSVASGSDNSGWLHKIAARCMASVGGNSRT